ncbi:MAG: hypothetical protein IRZ03_16235 [Acidobacterium ailaaui]|nr:hypothetical protein [Pseudacidobacterium ailaaui]
MTLLEALRSGAAIYRERSTRTVALVARTGDPDTLVWQGAMRLAIVTGQKALVFTTALPFQAVIQTLERYRIPLAEGWDEASPSSC